MRTLIRRLATNLASALIGWQLFQLFLYPNFDNFIMLIGMIIGLLYADLNILSRLVHFLLHKYGNYYIPFFHTVPYLAAHGYHLSCIKVFHWNFMKPLLMDDKYIIYFGPYWMTLIMDKDYNIKSTEMVTKQYPPMTDLRYFKNMYCTKPEK